MRDRGAPPLVGGRIRHTEVAARTVRVTVADDGNGRPHSAPAHDGFGIQTMRHRAASLRARSRIDSPIEVSYIHRRRALIGYEKPIIPGCDKREKTMWKKPSHPQSLKRAAEPITHRGKWHAVAIVCERYGCEAARALMATRFLASEAPRLPVTGCTAPEWCACKYKHYSDRRGAPRRKEDISGLRRRDHLGSERRIGHCRRLTDLNE